MSAVTRRWARRLICGYLVMLTAATAAVFTLQVRTNDLAHSLARSEASQVQLAHRLELSTISACHRLNLVRAGSNQSHYASWRFFRLTARLVRTAHGRPPPVAAGFAARLDEYASDLTWIPLTRSCRAVALGTSPAPPPVRFNVSRPSRIDLQLSPGE